MVKHRILLVDDDERIRTALRLALEDEGYVIDEAGSGEDALTVFGQHPADVVLIDVMLPGMTGFDACRTLRRTSDVPVVMVTARSDTHDVVAGLEAGADDYVTKPVVAKELAARIRALLRRARTPGPASASLEFGDLQIIPDEGIVRRGEEELHLTRTEFRLLCELASSPGRVFRESHCWKEFGVTVTLAMVAWLTCTYVVCAPRLKTTLPTPFTCLLFEVLGTSWRHERYYDHHFWCVKANAT